MPSNLRDMRGLEGEVLAGRYRLDRFLDQGGFGGVYRATHLAYGLEFREVAVKIARWAMPDSETRNVFKDALLMAALAESAPDAALRRYFVTIHDAGRCEEGSRLAGHPYVVMELVRGGSLARHLRSGPFPLTRAAAYFDQLLEAVAFMHAGLPLEGGQRRPLIHRDIKPDNVLVTRRPDAEDVIKVTDFGLAVQVDTLLGWVRSGGDLCYLAPEAFSHDISSPRSDVYMLALTFYELLTGVNPFQEVGSHLRGSSPEKRAELRRLHLLTRQKEAFALLERHEEIRRQPALGEVIRTALATDMEARTFADAGALRAAWQRAGAGSGPSRPPMAAAEPAWERVRRLTAEAGQCLAVGERERGQALLEEAMTLNRDRARVPDRMAVGQAYLVWVEQALRRGAAEEAGKMAAEGYARRRSRATCLAMARYYREVGSPAASRFEQEADSYRNTE